MPREQADAIIEHLNIRQLNPETDLSPKNISDLKQGGQKLVVVSSPSGGKSTLIKSIMWAKRHIFPVCTIFSGSDELTDFYGSFVPKCFVNGELDTKNMGPMDQLFQRQKHAKKFLENPWCFIVWDDCMSSSSFLMTKSMQHYFKNGRHAANMGILASQYLMDLKPNIRNLIDGIFILAEPSSIIRKKLWENYAAFISLELFNQLMDQLTANYGAMYINLRSGNTTNVYDRILWYRANPAEIPPDWKFGAQQFWNHAETRSLDMILEA